MTDQKSGDPFSRNRIQSSLLHFGIGKIVSGLIGLCLFIALVRLLPATDYGTYVTFVAMMEVLLIVSNLGVYPFAQRYITEARLPAHHNYLSFVTWASVLYRAATLSVSVILLMLGATTVLDSLGILVTFKIFALFCVAIFCEGLARYIDLLFDSLLEQARTQICILVRNSARLVMILGAIYFDYKIDIGFVAAVEAIAAGLGMLFSLFVLKKMLEPFGRYKRGGLKNSPFQVKRLLRFSLPYYTAQFLTQIYSTDTVKLVISQTLGAIDTAVFGFAHAISFIMQRYLPAQLLIGLLRPVLVARRAGGGSDAELLRLGNFILKVNHFLLVPVVSFFCVAGPGFVIWLSNGKYAGASAILILLSGLLLLQAVHAIMSAVAIALEDRHAVLTGTIGAIPGIGVGFMLIQPLGSAGMAVGLWLSELLWCSITWLMLRRKGFRFSIDWLAWAKLLVSGVAAGITSFLVMPSPSQGQELFLAAGIVSFTYLIICAVIKPFSQSERDILNGMLPVPVFIF